MRRNIPILIVLLMLAGFFFLRGGSAAPVPPMFEEKLTLAQASSKAGESSRVVLAFATADWCGPCQAFKKGALRDPKIEAWVREKAVPVYIDVDRNSDAKELPISSVPTMFMIRGGTIIGTLSGSVDADDMMMWLNTASEPGGG
jgi:thiol:disulfide interchange protein